MVGSKEEGALQGLFITYLIQEENNAHPLSPQQKQKGLQGDLRLACPPGKRKYALVKGNPDSHQFCL